MPTFSTLPDTLLVGGTDLMSLTGVVVEDLSGLFAPGTRRGGSDVIPGLRGQIGAELVYDSYAFSIPITVLCEDSGGSEPTTPSERRAQMIANLRGVAALLAGTGGLVALTRRLSKVGGGYDTHTASGMFVDGLQVELFRPDTGRTELHFVNLDGAWYDTPTTTWLVP